MGTNFSLVLEDSTDQIDFTQDTPGDFQLLDGTFECPTPEASEIRYNASTSLANTVTSRNYSNRVISFTYRTKSTTYRGLITNINRVYKMLMRAQTNKSLSGGSPSSVVGFNTAYTSSPYTKVNTTGDGGLVLRVRIGAVTNTSYTNERGETKTSDDTFTFNVVFGDQETLNPFSVNGMIQKTASEFYLAEVKLTLTCLPFATSEPIRYTTMASAYATPYPLNGETTSTRTCVKYVSTSVPGTADALVRVKTNLIGGTGVLMAVDTGNSIWNTPSVIRNSSKSYAIVTEIVPRGINITGGLYKVNLKLKSLYPVSFQYSVDGGGYSATRTPVQYEINSDSGIYLNGTDTLNVVFNTLDFRTGDYSVDDVLTFATHQHALSSTFSTVGSYDTYANRAAAKLEAGVTIATGAIVVQPGVTGKYKLYAQIDNVSANVQYALGVGVYGVDWGTSSLSKTAWSKPTVASCLVDMGVIDLNPSGAIPVGHPDAIYIVKFSVYMRISYNPVENDHVHVPLYYLVPCDEDTSYVFSGWVSDTPGVEVFSNFDPDNPKIYKVPYDFSTVTTTSISSLSWPLDETHAGNVITISPESKTSLMFVPLTGAYTDYRSHGAHTGGYIDAISVGVKPRYLFIG